VVLRGGAIPEHVVELLRSGQTEEAILAMRSLKTDSWAIHDLRLLLAAEGGTSAVACMRDDEVIDRVAYLLPARLVFEAQTRGAPEVEGRD
jgi:hypothetical protein